MKKIVHFAGAGAPRLAPHVAMFEENGVEYVNFPDGLPEEEVLKACEGADAIATCLTKFTREMIYKLPESVKCITRTAMGFEIIDVEAASERGIYVCNIPDYAMQEVAMHQVALIMALCRKLKHYDKFMHEGGWVRQSMVSGYECRRISALNVGLLGFGRIAKNVAKAMQSMGATVYIYDPYLTKEAVAPYGVEFCETKDELLSVVDVISANIPLTEESKHIINAESISKMKDGVIIVNTGRGALVDTDALVEGLKSGKIKAAGLDVHEIEPFNDLSHPLMNMENVILTPHIAFQSTESTLELEYKAALYTMQGALGEVPNGAVNRDKVKR